MTACGYVFLADSLSWVLHQRGISQDSIPQYVRQNVHVTDPKTGNRYQLVPENVLEGPALADSNPIMISKEPAHEMKITYLLTISD